MGAVAQTSFHPKFDLKTSEGLLTKILDSPKTTKEATLQAAIHLADSKSSDSKVMTLFQQILNSSKIESADLGKVVQFLTPTKMEKEEGMGDRAEGQMMGGGGGMDTRVGGFGVIMPNIPQERAAKLLELIAKSPKANASILSAVENAKAKLENQLMK